MMKSIVLLLTTFIFILSGCAQSNSNEERSVGSSCEDCEMMFEGMPQNLLWQTTISGSVIDMNNNAVTGANVYLEGTNDGSSTDSSGNFNFTASESGPLLLIVSMMGYETQLEVVDVTFLSDSSGQLVQIKKATNWTICNIPVAGY